MESHTTAMRTLKRPVLAAAALLAALLVVVLLGSPGQAGAQAADAAPLGPASTPSRGLAATTEGSPQRWMTDTVHPPEYRGTIEIQDDANDDTAAGDARPWDLRVHGPVTGVTKGVTDTLTINGKTVLVDAATWVKAQGALATGSWVQVKGILMPDGTIYATSIQWVHRVPAQAGQPRGPAAKLTPEPTRMPSQAPNMGHGKGSGQAANPAKGQGPAVGAGQGQGNTHDKSQGHANGKGHK